MNRLLSRPAPIGLASCLGLALVIALTAPGGANSLWNVVDNNGSKHRD